MDLALFDFDGTITVNDTFSSFLPHALSRRHLLLGRIVLAPVVVGYKLGLVSAPMARTLVSAFAFRGKDETALRAAGERYASERLPAFVRPHALERIRWHKARGDRVVVVSCSLDVYLAAWCRNHGLELICNELESRGGRMTGRLLEGDCGPFKSQMILERYRLGEYGEVYAYGDTHEDEPMLDLASRRYYRWQELPA